MRKSAEDNGKNLSRKVRSIGLFQAHLASSVKQQRFVESGKRIPRGLVDFMLATVRVLLKPNEKTFRG